MAHTKIIGALAVAAAFATAPAQAQEHRGPDAPHAAPPRPTPPTAPPRQVGGGGGHRFDGANGRREFLPGGGPRPSPGASRPSDGSQAGGPAVRSYQGPQGAVSGPVVRSYQGRGLDGYAGYPNGRGGAGQNAQSRGGQAFSRQGYDGYRAGAYGRGGQDRPDNGARGYGRLDGRQDRMGDFRRGGQDSPGYDGRGYGRFDRREGGGGFGYDRGDRRAFFYGGRTFYRVHAESYRWPDRRWIGHRWYAGAFLPPLFLVDDYFLTEYVDFGLAPPPYDCQWVRVGYDALLVNVDTGEVLDVVPGVFY